MAEAIAAAQDGSTVTLERDVVLTGGYSDDTDAGLQIEKSIFVSENKENMDDPVEVSGGTTFTAQWAYIPPVITDPSYAISVPAAANGTYFFTMPKLDVLTVLSGGALPERAARRRWIARPPYTPPHFRYNSGI